MVLGKVFSMLIYTLQEGQHYVKNLTLDVFFENYHSRLLFSITHSENCFLGQKPIIIDRGKETILSTGGRFILTKNRLSTKDSEENKTHEKVMEGFKENTAAGTIEFSVNSSSCFIGYFCLQQLAPCLAQSEHTISIC